MSAGHVPGADSPGTQSPTSAQEELTLWMDCARQLAGLTATLLRLTAAELDLAVASGRRIFLCTLLLVPMLLLAWLGISWLFAWLGYLLGLQIASPAVAVSLGLIFFIALQVAVILLLLQVCQRSRANMRFSQTRKHLSLFTQGLADGLQGPRTES